MTSTPKAADLPVGSVVADNNVVGIRIDREPRYGSPWNMSNGGYYHDSHIDAMLADGAQVLRIGFDVEQIARVGAAWEAAYREIEDCTCVENCDEDPPTACSLSGIPHVHPDDGSGTFGPCPVHPDRPGDH